MKLLSIVGALAVSLTLSASIKAAPADTRSVFAQMITEGDRDFAGRIGEKIKVQGESTYYQANPFENMIPGQQYIMQANGMTFLMLDFATPTSVALSREAFFSMPQWSDPRGTFTLEDEKNSPNPERKTTYLLLNGKKVASLMVYFEGKENIVSFGPIGGRAAAATPSATAPAVAAQPAAPAAVSVNDQKMQSFANGVQFLVQRAGGNFDGLRGELIRKTADGDPLYTTVMLADLQDENDSPIILGFQNRYFFLKTYQGEENAAFAFAAFQALPKLITQDRYEVELDRRLEKAKSSTYHLRYNGVIVGDLIKEKTEPKVMLNIGYRDGIPANMVMGTGRTYSQSAVDGAKRMINEATICAGCRGTGTEQIESKYVYKDTGLPKMVTVPCHFCHGTGHL
jgi:hypothetical protein